MQLEDKQAALQSSINLEKPQAQALVINKVLRNTYLLLSMVLAFSAVTAGIAIAVNAAPVNFIVLLVGFFGLCYLTEKFADQALGLVFVFALTGFMGYTIGPILNFYLSLSNGPDLVASAFGLTAFTFLGLSGYALTTRKDFSFLSGVLTAGFFVLMGSVLLNFFLQIPALGLAISAAFVLFSSMAILWQTSALINGGERNYIRATVTLFVSIYNIFLSLLQILGFMGGDD